MMKDIIDKAKKLGVTPKQYEGLMYMKNHTDSPYFRDFTRFCNPKIIKKAKKPNVVYNILNRFKHNKHLPKQ